MFLLLFRINLVKTFVFVEGNIIFFLVNFYFKKKNVRRKFGFFPAQHFFAYWVDRWMPRLRRETLKSTGSTGHVVVVVVLLL